MGAALNTRPKRKRVNESTRYIRLRFGLVFSAAYCSANTDLLEYHDRILRLAGVSNVISIYNPFDLKRCGNSLFGHVF